MSDKSQAIKEFGENKQTIVNIQVPTAAKPEGQTIATYHYNGTRLTSNAIGISIFDVQGVTADGTKTIVRVHKYHPEDETFIVKFRSPDTPENVRAAFIQANDHFKAHPNGRQTPQQIQVPDIEQRNTRARRFLAAMNLHA